MLNQNEQTLLDRLFGDDWKFRIFRSVAGFSPEDQIKSLGAYLRELVTKPREVLVGSPIASASTIHPTAAVDRVSGAVNISTISLSEAVPTAPAGRVWTVIPGGAFTWDTAGNIAVAGTAVVNRVLTFTYVPATDQ